MRLSEGKREAGKQGRWEAQMESEGRRRWRWRESDLHLVCPDAHSSGLAIESGPGWTLRPGLNCRLLVGREIERGRDQTVGGCSLSAVRVRAGQRDDNQLDSALLLPVSNIRSLCRVRVGGSPCEQRRIDDRAAERNAQLRRRPIRTSSTAPYGGPQTQARTG